MTPRATTNKNAVGMPTKYTEKLLSMALVYATSFEIFGDVIPSISGLAVVTEVSKATLEKWHKDKEKPEISEIIDTINAKQETILINKGLVGKFTGSMSKLLLGKHGYSDKQDTQATVGFTVNISNQDAETL